MNLYDIYLEALKNEQYMSNEIREILSDGKVNFSYDDLRIIDAKQYSENKRALSFIVYGLNNKPSENYVIEVSKGTSRPTVFAYQSSIVNGGFFPQISMDSLTVERLIEYAKEQSEYFSKEHTVDKIAKKIRPHEVDCSCLNSLYPYEIEILKSREVESLRAESSR